MKMNRLSKSVRFVLLFGLILSCLLIAILLYYVFFKSIFLNISRSPVLFVTVCEDGDDSCHVKGLPYQNASLLIDERVADLLGRMTISEKIGQMALIEKNSIQDSNDIAKYGLGAFLSGAGAKPVDNTAEGWFQMIEAFQGASKKTRLSIPLLYGVDAIHGHGGVPGATLFPHSIGLAASKNQELVREVAKATAEEVAATGVNWMFSPNLDVAQDIRWGRTYETFGSDPETVGLLGQAYIQGIESFQQNGLKMASTAKHYLGNGSTEWGSSKNKDFFIDQGNSNIGEVELRRVHLEPFTLAVNANVKSVMVGLHAWQGENVVFNSYLLDDVLKNELGFRGFVVSDWYGVYEGERDLYQALVRAVNAGVDMVMLPFDYKSFSEKMHRALAQGDIQQARVDEAVRRILKVKFEIGLFDSATIDRSSVKDVGSASHRELAQRAVRESLVLLKNEKVLPISKEQVKTILVAGSAADNIGKQSGAWTVEWQGIDGNWIPGTSILKGIQDTVSSDTKVVFDLKGKFPAQKGLADLGIAVIGEAPYAEGWGDRKSLALSAEDLQTISAVKKQSKKIMVIIVSGRPLDIQAYAKDWDAIIAAWLPGSEGQGIADVIFGEYPFVGVLPIAWELY